MTWRTTIWLAVLAIVLVPTSLRAEEELRIQIEDADWGDADRDDIHAVLTSAGRELLRAIPPLGQAKPIHVRVVPSRDAPQVDFRRDRDGTYIVRLAVRDRHWAQFAFQFGHELGHIVTHYERRSDNKLGPENQWFEESVCEAASLYVLTRMAETWKENPPYRNWAGYAPSLTEYAQQRINGTEAPTAEAMPKWFTQNRAALRADPYMRDRNRVVAWHLYQELDRDPSQWEAFRYLGLGRPDADNSFETYVENWYFSVPRAHKPLVNRVRGLLGIESELIRDHAGP